MADSRTKDFERRFALLERELALAREELCALRRTTRIGRVWRIVPTVATLACVAAFVLPPPARVEAQAPPQNSTVQVPLLVTDKAGQPILRVDEQGLTLRGVLRVHNVDGAASASIVSGILTLGDEKRGGITAGVGKSGTGFVLLRNVTGQDAIGLGAYLNRPMGVHVVGDDGMTPQASLLVNNGKGGLALGDLSGGGISAGEGVSGTGFIIVRGKSGTHSLRVGTFDGGPFAVSVMGGDGETPQATIGLDETEKGILRVGNPAGVRGVLGATKSGGVSFALYDRPGADYRVGLLAAPDNSFVRLNSEKNAVHLNADGGGAAVHVFNKLGNAAASLQSTMNGYGKLSIGDADGDTMVEAGVTTDQLGVVRAGPSMGGPVGGMAGLPWAIMGKKPK